MKAMEPSQSTEMVRVQKLVRITQLQRRKKGNEAITVYRDGAGSKAGSDYAAVKAANVDEVRLVTESSRSAPPQMYRHRRIWEHCLYRHRLHGARRRTCTQAIQRLETLFPLAL